MIKTLAFILAATLAACTGSAEVHYSGDSSRPQLVALDDQPDVAVVANADEPIFYTDHTFWLYRDHTWYRSSSHVSGWARAGDAPAAVTQLHQPEHYVHYRYNETGPRTTYNQHQPPEPPPPAAAPETRDHRAPDAPMPAEQIQTPRSPITPAREPNAQAPIPPPANPLPPTQVPPPVP